MKKTFALPLVAALLLAACSNPAGGIGEAPSVTEAPQTVGTTGTAETPSGTGETPSSGGEQKEAPQPAQAESEVWPKITPVNWEMDLEGYEEAPKDPVYGINWVYVAKADVDMVASQGNDNRNWLFQCGKNIGLKPIELHKCNPNGVKFYPDMAITSDGFSDVYKCVLYYKKNAKSNIKYTPGLGYDFNGKYFTAPGLEFKYGSATKEITISVNQEAVENFKKNYGQL